MVVNDLSPTEGFIVAGTVLDEHRIACRVRGDQLLQVALDPRKAEKPKLVQEDVRLARLKELRETMQRIFFGAKSRNVAKYSRYIVDVHEGGRAGTTPSIMLYSPEKLEVQLLEHGTCLTQIPWGTVLAALDGETQLAARFDAKQRCSATGSDYVSVILFHGIPIETAQQYFHDLNLLSVRPNTAIGISMDNNDPITQLARLVEDEVPFFRSRVNHMARQLKKSDQLSVMTLTALRGACATLAGGIGAVQYGVRPMPVDKMGADIHTITEVAVDWFTAVTERLGPAIEDRECCLASAPAVLAAVGAMAYGLVKAAPGEERVKLRGSLLHRLEEVNWEKGKAWEGVAGKFTPKGRFSVGGTKETVHAIYAALMETDTPGYARIRRASEAA